MNMNNLNRRNKNRNENDFQLDGNNDKIDNRLGNFLEKSRNVISQYMNFESKRLKEIMLKEEELKIKRVREDGQRARERLEEDIQIKKEKEIIEFEEEIKRIYLKKKLRDDFEGLQKEEKIISLNEESGEQNMDIKPKKNLKKQKEKKLISMKIRQIISFQRMKKR